MNSFRRTADDATNSPPSEASLFALAILGKPMPRILSEAVESLHERKRLESLAQFSVAHADELNRLQSEETEARRKRELLEWAAGVSTRADDELRLLQRNERAEREAWRRAELFAESLCEGGWDASKHPRQGGPPNAGWFASTGSSGGGNGRTQSGDSAGSREGDGSDPYMLELAHTWWHTKGALQKARRDLAELPGRIAREREMLGSGGRYAYLHAQNLEKAQRDLEAAKVHAPQLEKQLGDLEQTYHDSGFDKVHHSSWTPGETLVGGKGIEEVGRAVAGSGSPAGIQPTRIEVDLISAAMAAPAILRLGRALLTRGLRKAPAALEGSIDDFVSKLPRKSTPTSSAANQYEIKHTGPYNYTVSGGGVKFDIDGYRGSTILESKHVGSPNISPFVPGSFIRDDIRSTILAKVRRDLTKLRTIIKSGETPFKSVEIITNSPNAKAAFEAMLKELSVPGTVRLEP